MVTTTPSANSKLRFVACAKGCASISASKVNVSGDTHPRTLELSVLTVELSVLTVLIFFPKPVPWMPKN